MTLNPIVLTITTLAVVGSAFNAPATGQGQADKRPFIIPIGDTVARPGPLVATSYGCVQVLRGSVVVVAYASNGVSSGYVGPVTVPAGYSVRNCIPSQGVPGITGYIP
jgi:hypothetical protein